MQFITEKNALIARRGGETLRIEGWGRDSLRVRAVMYDGWTGNDWALTETPEETTCEVQTGRDAEGMPCAQIRNGRLSNIMNQGMGMNGMVMNNMGNNMEECLCALFR